MPANNKSSIVNNQYGRCVCAYDWDWLKIWHITCNIPLAGAECVIFIDSLLCEQSIGMVDLIRFKSRNFIIQLSYHMHLDFGACLRRSLLIQFMPAVQCIQSNWWITVVCTCDTRSICILILCLIHIQATWTQHVGIECVQCVYSVAILCFEFSHTSVCIFISIKKFEVVHHGIICISLSTGFSCFIIASIILQEFAFPPTECVSSSISRLSRIPS